MTYDRETQALHLDDRDGPARRITPGQAEALVDAVLQRTALPVTTLIASRIVLGEAVSWQQAVGAALVVAAIAVGATSARGPDGALLRGGAGTRRL